MKNSQAQILIVEDEIVIGMTMKNKLQSWGYAVSAVVDSWEDAAEILEKSHHDLVLMDIFIKGKIDGIELAQQIIKEMKIAVIFVSAYYDEIIRQRVAQIQHSGHIIKPFNDKELKTTIENALKNSKENLKI